MRFERFLSFFIPFYVFVYFLSYQLMISECDKKHIKYSQIVLLGGGEPERLLRLSRLAPRALPAQAVLLDDIIDNGVTASLLADGRLACHEKAMC